MTTVFTDGKKLVVDSLIQSAGVNPHLHTKMYHRPGYGAIAISGYVDAHDAVAEWVFFQACQECKRPKDTEWNMLLLNTDGRLFLAGNDTYLYEVSAPIGLGSGWHIALGAYAVSKDPAQAVIVAANYDVYTGGPVNVYDFETDHTCGGYINVIKENLNERICEPFSYLRPKTDGVAGKL